jgi:hypothetical protein
MDAVKRMKWKEFVQLMHPEALQSMKEMFMPVLQAVVDKDEEDQAEVLAFFSGASEVKTVMALPPSEFFESFLKGALGKVPNLKKIFSGMNFQVIGTVREGKDLAHVVCRMPGTISGCGSEQDGSDLLEAERPPMADVAYCRFERNGHPTAPKAVEMKTIH